MLAALIYMYVKAGSYSIAASRRCRSTLIEQRWIFIAFLLAFAVKVPMWPVHTWLPDAHVEAPTGGSVILAAIMLKMGGYGFLRFSLPVTPDASRELDLAGHRAVADRGHLHRLRRAGAAGHEEAHRLLLDRAHGFRDARRVRRLRDRAQHRQPAGRRHGHGRRDGADGLARPDLGRAVPVRRRALRPPAQPRRSPTTAAWSTPCRCSPPSWCCSRSPIPGCPAPPVSSASSW